MDSALKDKVNLLIQLAKIDGHFDIKERAFIYNVCIRNGVMLDTIGDLIEHPKEMEIQQGLSLDTRIDYLTDCLLLIVVNGEILPKEINFFFMIGSQLGFDKSVLNKLIMRIRTQPDISTPALKRHIRSLIRQGR